MALYCPVCDREYPLEEGLLRCPKSSAKGAHPLMKTPVPAEELEHLYPGKIDARWKDGALSFVVFRELLGSYRLAAANGKAGKWQELVQKLSKSCESLTGRGFVRTPSFAADALAGALEMPKGSLWLKDETAQLMGSHKARHMIGAVLYLETLRMIEGKEDAPRKNLAIFSCGNAAMAAAAVAKAAEYPLYTFVPEHVNDTVVSILTNLGAYVVKVSRDEAVGLGDPCQIMYQRAVDELGFVPFSCYGHDCWASMEGAEPLGYELFYEANLAQAPLDNLIVQIGGGGLANALIRSAKTCKRMGLLRKIPKFYALQTKSCYPLAQSYLKILKKLHENGVVTLAPELAGSITDHCDAFSLFEGFRRELNMTADLVSELYKKDPGDFKAALLEIAANRNEYFKPWTANVPDSIAEGILDDTTYDGLEIIDGMLESGGLPLIADETTLKEAHDLSAKHTKVSASETGTAGFAGLLVLKKAGLLNKDERYGAVLTGVAERTSSKPVVEKQVFKIRVADKIHSILPA